MVIKDVRNVKHLLTSFVSQNIFIFHSLQVVGSSYTILVLKMTTV
jgi:hypothetical protein